MVAIKSIDIRSEALRIRILAQGAALVGVRFADTTRNLVLGFADPADHLNVPIYAGSLVGPVANRVRDGRVPLDGQDWHMPCNEAGRTALHSGPDGLHVQSWRVTERATDSVTLTCTLPAGLGGLPGTRQFVAQYHVAGSCLTLTIRAHTDQATPINVAAHPYWNLDGKVDVSGHHLEVYAPEYLPTDAHSLPTGEVAAVMHSQFDFRTAKPVPVSQPLDVNFCLADHMRDTPQPAAKLTGADGTTLRIATTSPGLQVYNGAFLPTHGPETADAPAIAPYSAIAMEPQHWPDAPHHQHFPQITLLPKAIYRQVTTYTLSQD